MEGLRDREVHGEEYQDEELQLKHEKRASFMRSTILTVIYICMWYTFSVSISVYNKWMFGTDGLDFNFPVISTSFHQIVQFFLAFVASRIRDRWFSSEPQYAQFAPVRQAPSRQSIESTELSTGRLSSDSDGSHDENEFEMTQEQEVEVTAQPKFDWHHYFKRIVPCALASAGDIGLGNLSFRVVTLTFYTMVKSSHLGFVLVFSVLFRLEKLTLKLVLIVSVMTIGVIMMVAGETEFKLLGLLLVLGAAACSGLRWSLTQILLKTNDRQYHGNPITTILYLSPAMGAILFIWGCILESPIKFVTAPLWAEKGPITGMIILIIPGTIAFFMTLSEFLLLNQTSVLTLSIAGIFKEVVTLLTAHVFFGDELTLVNVIGMLITFAAIIGYNIYRYDQRMKAAE